MFTGFTDSETFTPVPDSFFRTVLNEITETTELKVTLYALWRIGQMDGTFRALSESDFDGTELGLSPDEIRSGIEKSVQRGSILRATNGKETFYFLNSPRGRASASAFAQGQERDSARLISAGPSEHPNIFRQYEENIGPLTPLIADALKDAEAAYPPEWIDEAISQAVRNNKRNLRYIEAILKRWKEDGRGEKQDRRDVKKDHHQNLDRKIAELRRRSQK